MVNMHRGWIGSCNVKVHSYISGGSMNQTSLQYDQGVCPGLQQILCVHLATINMAYTHNDMDKCACTHNQTCGGTGMCLTLCTKGE